MSTHPVSRVSRSILQAGWQWSRFLLPVLLAVTLSACSRGQGDAKPDGADDGTANQPPPVPVEVAAAAARWFASFAASTAASGGSGKPPGAFGTMFTGQNMFGAAGSATAIMPERMIFACGAW